MSSFFFKFFFHAGREKHDPPILFVFDDQKNQTLRYESFWHTTKSTTQGCIYYILYLCLGYKWQTLFFLNKLYFFFFWKKWRKFIFSVFWEKKWFTAVQASVQLNWKTFSGLFYTWKIYTYTHPATSRKYLIKKYFFWFPSFSLSLTISLSASLAPRLHRYKIYTLCCK